jgi:hypothetical protein
MTTREAIELAARVADAAVIEANRIAKMHPEDSPSRDRMFARAREARRIAQDIRALCEDIAS